MDVEIHGGLSRDGLAGRSPATCAAPSAGMLVHPITCDQRGGLDATSTAGNEENGGRSVVSANVPLGNQRQHSKRLSLFLSIPYNQKKTQAVSSPVDFMRIFPRIVNSLAFVFV